MNGILDIQFRYLIGHREMDIKMNKANIRQWLLFKLMAVFTIAASIAFIYLNYYLAVTYDTKSLIIQGDIIQYDGKVIISLCGIPFFYGCSFLH